MSTQSENANSLTLKIHAVEATAPETVELEKTQRPLDSSHLMPVETTEQETQQPPNPQPQSQKRKHDIDLEDTGYQGPNQKKARQTLLEAIADPESGKTALVDVIFSLRDVISSHSTLQRALIGADEILASRCNRVENQLVRMQAQIQAQVQAQVLAELQARMPPIQLPPIHLMGPRDSL